MTLHRDSYNHPDSVITHEVVHSLLWNASLSPASVEVTTKNGVVMLSGKVDNHNKKWSARQVAQNVTGVEEVIDTVLVKPSLRKTDDEIAQNVRDFLRSDTRIDDSRIKVEVNDGFVTLTATLPSLFQKMAAEETARWVIGVIDVRNMIAIDLNAVEIDVQLKQQLESMLNNNKIFKNSEIKIEVKNKNVTLNGKVNLREEKLLAEALVSSIVTINQIDNRIKIR